MKNSPPQGSPRSGRWEKQLGSDTEPVYSFVPAPLPPDPPVRIEGELADLAERANRALGRVDSLSRLLPDPSHFLYTYVRKEAVLSSQIEGTQSSLSDLLLFEMDEAPGVPEGDVQEVSNYVAAMNHGLRRLRKDGFPISLRLMREIHGILMRKGRGSDKTPGEFRTTQNWIGGERPGTAFYVPPPPQEVLPAMGALEKFLHNIPQKTPTLVKAGLAHAQFETIHPFLDGNGRLGRLLITFILCAEGALSEPLLYLSLYFKQHRQAYYDALQKIRTDGDWEGWIRFYLAGVESVSSEATEAAGKIVAMFDRHRKEIQALGKAAGTALDVHDLLKHYVIISQPFAQKRLDISFPAISKAMDNLAKLGIVKEVTGKKRNRSFGYAPYLNLLLKGTEEPPQ